MQFFRKYTWQVSVLLSLTAGGMLYGCQFAYSNGAGGTSVKSTSTAPWQHDASAQLPAKPVRGALPGFWKHWGDGKGELTGYKGKVSRYGQLRDATAALVYVTETMDRRKWIKDDSVRSPYRVPVLKLNYALKFQTGIYPYSVLTSVFTAVGKWREESFPPVKVTLTAQEWCGHIFHGIWPGQDDVVSKVFSYFASEGEQAERIKTGKGALYEDALMIQLRELDGAFAGGKDWSGSLIPSLWTTRKAHRALRPVQATIARKQSLLGTQKVHHFTLKYKGVLRDFYVERGGDHRLLRWTSSDGEDMRLQKTKRLAYWGLSGPGGKSYRKQIGLK
ncbi:MAG TPA: hypothetical protein DCE42_26940 [Myxococcales bacterium]|nr:hypothetical protein [Deltaproteobacteria bacterium]MBU52910.1 hypothetical protein [Deltaproteobacteria bacterium]HAA58429.1 hypothetical protein [Myxococcales bacterium]|tara:strand:+ start:3365 stop:4363 length:999 start_codon:yes stop_codon:yes gene_type:complete